MSDYTNNRICKIQKYPLIQAPILSLAAYYPAFSKSGGNLVGMRLGRTDKGTVSTDTAIDLIKGESSVEELIHRLMD